MLNDEMYTWDYYQWNAIKLFGIHFRAFLVGQESSFREQTATPIRR